MRKKKRMNRRRGDGGGGEEGGVGWEKKEHVYSSCYAFDAIVKTSHKAVVVRADGVKIDTHKIKTVYNYRPRKPDNHAAFLKYLGNFCWDDVMCCGGIEQAFDTFYTMALGMLDAFYPVKSITVSNRDPVFVTPEIKSLLRKINKLRRSGKIEAANSLSEKISKIIIRRNSYTFSKTPRGSRELWERVNKITGKSKISQGVSQSSINADSLNAHYASMSTDKGYETPVTKRPEPRYFQTFSEYEVFNQLDTLGATACGLDGLPHWFLRIAAPCFSTPIAFLFNLSLTWSMVPSQWKASRITPVPKVPRPIACSDFRPISITPILSRIMERTIVRQFFFPILHSPLFYSSFSDQFAFRPTGSTTCALIKLTYELTTMLQEYPYVHVISLDFSKAFDTVRHSSLVQKLSQFPIPNPVHNWFVNYLSGRIVIARNFSPLFQAYSLLTLAYFRVLPWDLYRMYSTHPILFLVALAIASINMLTTHTSWFPRQITLPSTLNLNTSLNGLLPIT